MATTRRTVLVQLSALAVTACAGDPATKGDGRDTAAAGGDGTDGTSGADGTDGTDGTGGEDGTGGTDTGGDWRAECETDAALPTECERPTPFQSEGPFLRGDVPEREELNVTGDVGDVLLLTGRIVDFECAPVQGVEILVWMAGGAEAFYDTESADANLYGRQITGDDGAFCFRTLKPTPYGPEGNRLPAHIHVAVEKEGARLLTTQLYFEGDEYLEEVDFPPPPEVVTNPEVMTDGSFKLAFDFVLPADPPPS